MGGSVSLGYDRLLKSTSGGFRNFHAGEATVIAGNSISEKAGFPNGATHPYSWSLGIKAGGLSAYNSSNIAFSAAASILSVQTMDATSSIVFTVDGALGLVIQLGSTSSITFTATVDLDGIALMDGASSIVFSSATDLSNLTSLVGTGTITFSSSTDLTGIASLEGTSGGAEALSAEGLAAAVWGRAVEGGYTAEEILRILAAVAAGNATSLEGAAPVFRDLEDTKNRIEATYSSGTRTIDILDVT
jgi:hypothetical protein